MTGAHVAIVLAAGASRRLGMPKQLLTRDGEALLHRVVRLVAMTRPRRLLVIVGAYREPVAAAVADLAVDVLFNPDWQQGLASSLRCAERALRDNNDPVLVLGCDQPALETDHLRRLLAGAASVASGCAATVHGARLGSPAVIPAAMLQLARELDGDCGLGHYLSDLPDAAVWRLSAPELTFDLDTEADVQTAVDRGLLDAAAPS